jgi:hypothetical protein
VMLDNIGQILGAGCGGEAATPHGWGCHGCGVGLLHWAQVVSSCLLRAKALTSI